jgi:hypothetical protein
MKQAILIFSILAALTSNAQGLQPVNQGGNGANASIAKPATSLNYRIDFIRPDSFYLVEIKTITDAPGKRGKVEEESVFLSDTAQLTLIIKNSIAQEQEMERKLNEFRAMRANITEMYAILRQKINDNQ